MPKPRVLLVTLERNQLDHILQFYLRKLPSLSELDVASNESEVVQKLSSPPPRAVIVADGIIAQLPDTLGKLLEYAHAGGTLIFAANFPLMVEEEEMDYFWESCGLPWKYSTYYRAVIHLNPSGEGARHGLSPTYQGKFFCIKGVQEKDVWYCGGRDHDETEPKSGGRLDRAVIALTKVGEGKIGYVGGTPMEDVSEDALYAMCGLREPAS